MRVQVRMLFIASKEGAPAPTQEVNVTDLLHLPRLLTEAEAAEKLGMTVYTLARERKAGRIRHRKPRRGVRYTAADLAAYVESILVPACRDTESEPASKSAATGSASDRIAQSGAGPGSIVSLDRLAAHRLAQQTLKPRSSS